MKKEEVNNSSKKEKKIDIENITKYQTEYKINRSHRTSPPNLINIQESEKEINNSARHMTPENKKKKKEIDDELFKEEIEKEIKKRRNIFHDFKLLYSKMKIDRLLEEENSNELNLYQNDSKFKKENMIYYIINKTWFHQFKNYCTKTDLSYANINEDYPGQINNQHLILKDDTCLKLNSEKRIIINSKFLDNCTCISQEMWLYLIKLCGGGPEIKFIPYKANNDINEINTIKRGVHINLIFIPKKDIIANNNNKEPSNNLINPLNPFQCQDIKKILINSGKDNSIKIETIYYDITKNVKELLNYINQILNEHRDKFTNTPIFFGPSFNSEGNNYLVENINYRLWILNTELSPENIKRMLESEILKNEDPDFLLNFNQINNNFNKEDNDYQEFLFYPYLLTNFLSYKISDIFPNRYTKNFNNPEEHQKYEDNNLMPIMNILIEEHPYHFDNPKRAFYIKKCNQCNDRDYVFSSCLCEKAYYCSEECRKKNMTRHMMSCKIGLYNFLMGKNKNLYRIIRGRKEYFERNTKEKEKFPLLGLTNLGNSCYMNASLQCLFAIKELSNYFLYYFNEDYLNKDNILGTGGILTLGYINLLLNINNTTNNKFITPENFKLILSMCSRKYEGNEQEDAHEFINYLLDMLHEDLNKVVTKPGKTENSVNLKYKNSNDEERSIIDWNNFLKRNQSLLIDLFYGQLKSCVTCPNCNFHSINFNPFLSLELSINQEKNYELINVEFIDYLKENSCINFNIILYKNEMKAYYLRKKISNLLDLDILEFELVVIYHNQIIHIFNLDDEIPSGVTNFSAIRVNPSIFYSQNNKRYNEIINIKQNDENENINNINDVNRHNIDFINLECNVNKRKNDIIKLNQNNNTNDNFFSLCLQYKDNLGLDEAVYHRAIIDSFIKGNYSINNFEKDEIIYLEKNKKCTDIYFEIFKKYALNIISQSFISEEKRNRFIDLYRSGKTEEYHNKLKKLFYHYFKNVGIIHPSKLDIKNNFPDCPFILFLRNIKYNRQELIPFLPEINYQDILNIFYEGINFEKNKYNHLRQYNLIKQENNIEEDNENLGFSDFISQVLNEEDKNKESKKGLKGGNDDENENGNEKENSESNEEESETDENKNENEENEDNEDNNNDNNSDKELDIDIDNNSNNSYSPYKTIIMKDNEENIKKIGDENDENMDRITIIWNHKYLNNVSRFPEINLYNICENIYEKSTNRILKLEKCIEEFSKEEKLDNDNLWKCDNCKKELEANKKIELYHIPKILIITLKRFNHNKKLNTLIEFPLQNLDLNKYIKSDDQISKYDLFGVINHFGSLEYGHYTSFCKNYHDNLWYEYNDRIVNKIQKEKENEIIVNKNAYILFYRAQDSDYIIWENIYNKELEIISENNLKKYGEDFIYMSNSLNNIESKESEEKIDINKLTLEDAKDIFISDENNKNENIDDDNFSFKEGLNNKSCIIESNDNKAKDYCLNETPKFKNKSKNSEDIKKMINFKLNENYKIETIKVNNSINVNNNEYKTEIKENKIEDKILEAKGINITHNNVFRIKTYFKPKVKCNLNSDNKNNILKKDNGSMQNENELLKYDVFNINQARKLFQLNGKNSKKGLQSVKNKELCLFLLKEFSDNKSDKVPRSKKLYDDITRNDDNKKINNENNKNDIKVDENSKYICNSEINLEDYVYNPFKNCYLKMGNYKTSNE